VAADFDIAQWMTTEYAGEAPSNLFDLVWNPSAVAFDRQKVI
jgi:hypothetical protein